MKSSNIGGQAVMEGIMMRHKDKYSIAVRRPDKEIEVKVEDYKCIFGKARIWRKPIIRGMVSFIDSLVTGTKCLMYSAEIAGDEEDEEETRKNAALSSEELEVKKKKEDKAFKALLYVTVAVSIVISIAAFMLLPYALASLCRKVGASEVVVTIVEAFVKLGLFMGYMLLIFRELLCIMVLNTNVSTVWRMVSRLLWRTCLRAPDSTDAAEQAFCSWL